MLINLQTVKISTTRRIFCSCLTSQLTAMVMSGRSPPSLGDTEVNDNKTLQLSTTKVNSKDLNGRAVQHTTYPGQAQAFYAVSQYIIVTYMSVCSFAQRHLAAMMHFSHADGRGPQQERRKTIIDENNIMLTCSCYVHPLIPTFIYIKRHDVGPFQKYTRLQLKLFACVYH